MSVDIAADSQTNQKESSMNPSSLPTRSSAAWRRRDARTFATFLASIGLAIACPATVAGDERALVFETVVAAPVAEVWRSWTTVEGVRGFMAPEANIELEPGGAYEIFFEPQAAVGDRGGEGNRVLAVDPPRMLSFSWNAPPHLETVRPQRTHVVVRLSEVSAGSTRVVLRHDGWGQGGQWEEAVAYFQRAWGEIVLPRLQQRYVPGRPAPLDPPHPAFGCDTPWRSEDLCERPQ
jgi:uncharacterized protein YndB with AHSA1/START domain